MKMKRNFLALSLLFISLFSSSNTTATIISELYITEVMANPSAVSDTYGEWFELYNPTTEAFELNGIALSDNGSNYHIISSTDSLLIMPGEYFVLGRNDDPLLNGGYNPDYIYSNFVLGNSDDEIILTDTLGNQLILEYLSGFVENGHSLELTTTVMNPANYIATYSFTYGSGDYGTPGSQGNNLIAVPQISTLTANVPAPETLWLCISGLIIMLCKKQMILL